MSSLSVVIPRYQPGLKFETTLGSVLRYRLARHQIIAVMPQDQFDDYGLADEVTFVACQEQPGYRPFLKAVLPQVTGEVVFVLQPGVEVSSQWFAPAMRALSERSVGCVSLAVESGMGGGLKRSLGLGLRTDFAAFHVADRKNSVVGPTGLAAAFRTELLRRLLPVIDEVDDRLFGLEFALSARLLGLQCSAVDESGISVSESLSTGVFGNYSSGLFAARLRERYSLANRSVLSKVAGAFRRMTDLVTPARWSFLVGQYRARQFLVADAEYASRLSVMIRETGIDYSPAAMKPGKAA